MPQPRITIAINGKTYSVCADNAEAIGNMPLEDRQYLVTLLEVVKSRTDPALAAAHVATGKPSSPAPEKPALAAAATLTAANAPKPARVGSGDIDALVARLAAEDLQNRKPVLTRAGVYKVTGGFLLVIFLLVVLLG